MRCGRLTNVIDLNFFPVPYAKINNEISPDRTGCEWVSPYACKTEFHGRASSIYNLSGTYFLKSIMLRLRRKRRDCEEGKLRIFEGLNWQTEKYFDETTFEQKKWNRFGKIETARDSKCAPFR